MKAIIMISRVGQIIILAIAFMACVGWNQAAGLQNNIASITHNRVKDIVKIRYILPQTNLHSTSKLCKTPDSNTAFDSKNATDNLNNQITWTGAENPDKQSAQFCKTDSGQPLAFDQTKVVSPSSILAAYACQDKLSVSDALQGEGHFSGFQKSAASTSLVNSSTQDIVGNVSLVSAKVSGYRIPAEPVYVAFGNAGCTVTVCHMKKDMPNGVDPTLLDENNPGYDEVFADGVSGPVTMECQTK